METFKLGTLEEILTLLTKFDKNVIGIRTTSFIGKINFLQTPLHGEVQW